MSAVRDAGRLGMRQRRSVKKWALSASESVAQIPRPSDYPQVHSDGIDADRILVVGSGLAVGYGTTSHEDALPGRLAHAFTELTARGTDVDVIADGGMTLRSATADLPSRKLWRFDLVVVTLGTNEALALESAKSWRADLRRFLAAVAAAAVPATRIALVGIPSVRSLAPFQGPEAVSVDALARTFDTVSAEVAAQTEGVVYVALPALESDTAHTDYEQIAETIVDALLDELNTARETSGDQMRGSAGQDTATRERERQEALEALGVLDTEPEDRFDRIVSMAQKIYGTDGAAFTIIDNDRVWHKARTPNVPLQVPRNASFCDMTIEGRGAHVIPDVLLTDRLPGDMTAAEEVGVRFYAGYPVEAPNGQRIGALCVFDSEPRGDHDVDEALLRQLALLIQAELRVEAIH